MGPAPIQPHFINPPRNAFKCANSSISTSNTHTNTLKHTQTHSNTLTHESKHCGNAQTPDTDTGGTRENAKKRHTSSIDCPPTARGKTVLRRGAGIGAACAAPPACSECFSPSLLFGEAGCGGGGVWRRQRRRLALHLVLGRLAAACGCCCMCEGVWWGVAVKTVPWRLRCAVCSTVLTHKQHTTHTHSRQPHSLRRWRSLSQFSADTHAVFALPSAPRNTVDTASQQSVDDCSAWLCVVWVQLLLWHSHNLCPPKSPFLLSPSSLSLCLSFFLCHSVILSFRHSVSGSLGLWVSGPLGR